MKNNTATHNEEKILKCKAIFKIPAGAASAKAPLGPALGQYGIPIAEFCTRYNTLTEEYKAGTILKALVNLYEDNTYDISIQNPDAAFYIKMALERDEIFSTKKNNKIKGKNKQKYKDIISTNILYEIADAKYKGGLSNIYSSVKPLYKSLVGTARSMGLIVIPKK